MENFPIALFLGLFYVAVPSDDHVVVRIAKTPLSPAMHLVACARPQEPLEDAPRSGLLSGVAPDERWDGFWSDESDDYFVRCTRVDGATLWFRVEDETTARRTTEPRGLDLTAARLGRVAVVVARSPNGRRMLVGSARRPHR